MLSYFYLNNSGLLVYSDFILKLHRIWEVNNISSFYLKNCVWNKLKTFVCLRIKGPLPFDIR